MQNLPPGDPILKRPLKVACIQMSSTPDKLQNLSNARQKVFHAASQGAALIILPECFNAPYSTTNFLEHAEQLSSPPDPIRSPSFAALARMARESGAFIIGGSVPERDEAGKIYNTSTVYSPQGELLASHRKVHLFDIDIPDGISFHESDTLSAGEQVTVVEIGGYGKIGLGICYDIRFPELGTVAARRGAFALVYPSAFNTTTGPLHWELLGRARAVDNQVYTVLCSQSRDETSSYAAWGYSMVTDPMGRIIAQAQENDGVFFATLDPVVMEDARRAIPITSQRRHDVYPDIAQLFDLGG